MPHAIVVNPSVRRALLFFPLMNNRTESWIKRIDAIDKDT